MTESREMLYVAQTALEMMHSVDEKEQIDVFWIAAITALRSVGHVLQKVDCANNLRLKEWKNILANKSSVGIIRSLC